MQPINKPTTPLVIRTLVFTLALCAAFILSSQSARAQSSGVWTGGGGDGLWTGDTANWLSGTVATGSGQTADFSQFDVTGTTIVHLDAAVTIGNLIFGNTDASPTHNWVLDPNGNTNNTLTFAGGTSTITVTNMGTGKVIVTNVIDGTSGLVKDGPGTLEIDSACYFTGGTTIKNGTLILGLSFTAGEQNQTDVYTLGSVSGGPATLAVNLVGHNLMNPISLATNAVGPLSLANFGAQKADFFGNISLNGNNLIFTNGPDNTSSKYLVSDTITGIGNINCINNSQSGNMTIGTMNNTGTVTLGGASTAATGFNVTFGANVTGLNYAGPATVAAFTAPANPNGLTISSSSTVAFGAITLASGLSNLTVNANSTGTITIGTVPAAFKGFIENSGTGAGSVFITPALGTTITALSNIIQNGASPLVLSGANTYTVPTLVQNGPLLWNGPLTTALKGSPITVSSGGILGGTGGIANLVTVQAGGTLAPGTNTFTTNGILTLTNNTTTMLGGLSLSGNLLFKLNKFGSTKTNDFVLMSGTAALTNLGTGTLTLTNIGSVGIASGDKFTLFSSPLIGGGNLTIFSSYGKFTNNLAVDGSVTAGNAGPFISSITPAVGSTFGGTTVNLYGTGFASGAGVNFGSTPAASVVLNGSTNITVTTPTHSAGMVTVTVTNLDGQSATTSFTYVAVPAPAISSLSPSNGPTGGGTLVTITGSNFVSGDTVQFGSSTPITATFNGSTSLSVTTPPHLAGTVNVTVTDIYNQVATAVNGFTFALPTPDVWIAANGGGDGLWTGDTNNWLNGLVPNGVDQTADLSQGDYTGFQNVHLDAPVTEGFIVFGTTDTNSQVDWNVDDNATNANANILTLKTSVGIPTITVTDPLGLGNNATITASIAGTNGLEVTGGGELTLGVVYATTTNTFTGGITVANGTLQLYNNSGDANSSDTVTVGSTNVGSSATLLLGNGAFPNPIVLPAGAQGTLTIGADPVNGGHQAVTGPAINLNGNTLTFVQNSSVTTPTANSYFKNGVTGNGNLILVQDGSGVVLNNGTYANVGSLTLEGTGSGKFNLGTLGSGITTFNYESSTAAFATGTTPIPISVSPSGTIINSGSTLNLPVTIGSTGNNLTLNANSTGNIVVSALNFQFAGFIVNSGTGTGTTAISASIFSNSGMTSMVQDSATSTLVLSGGNYYTVPTLVSNGTLLVNGNGSAGQKGSPITVYSGGVLGGTGSIANLITVQPGGELAPGTNDNATIGTLTITNGSGFAGALSLAGNLFFKVSNGGGQSNDFVTGTTLLTNIGTGTLTVLNVGPQLNPGDAFQLFSHPLIGGGALTIVGPTNFINNLAVDGSIVVGGGSVPTPATGTASISGSTLTLVWTGGANQNCVLLSTTDVTQPRSTWTPIATNAVGAGGLSTNMITIPMGDPQRFFSLAIPY